MSFIYGILLALGVALAVPLLCLALVVGFANGARERWPRGRAI